MENEIELSYSADLFKKFVRNSSYEVILLSNNGVVVEVSNKIPILYGFPKELFINKRITAARRTISIDNLDNPKSISEKFQLKYKKIKRIELIFKKNIKLKIKARVLPIIFDERKYYVIFFEDELNSEGVNLDATHNSIESQFIYADVKAAITQIINDCESLNDSYSFFLPRNVSENLKMIVHTLRDWE